MERLKSNIRSQMEVLEVELGKEQFPKRSLARKLGHAEKDWNKIEDYYMHILTLIDEQEAEDGRLAHEQFQTQYLTMIGRVQDALDTHREEEEAQERDSLKVTKVRQLGERWVVAYQHIETILGELKTRLEGEAIDNVEQLGVQSAQLDAIKAQINSAAALVDSMFTANPDQTVITLEAQGTRRTAAEVKVHACEELMAKMQVAISAKNAALVEAATATAAPAEVD